MTNLSTRIPIDSPSRPELGIVDPTPQGPHSRMHPDGRETPLGFRESWSPEELDTSFFTVKTRVIERQVVEATDAIAVLLGLELHAEVVKVTRLSIVTGAPVALLVDYLRPDSDRCYSESPFSISSYNTSADGRITKRTFSAETAPPELARILQLEPFAPVQYVQELTTCRDGNPIGYRDSWINTQRMRPSCITPVLELV